MHVVREQLRMMVVARTKAALAAAAALLADGTAVLAGRAAARLAAAVRAELGPDQDQTCPAMLAVVLVLAAVGVPADLGLPQGLAVGMEALLPVVVVVALVFLGHITPVLAVAAATDIAVFTLGKGTKHAICNY